MSAGVAVRVDQPYALSVIDRPEVEAPGAGEISISVQRAGICGSDMHILHGANPFAVYPRIIGHEFAGTVAAVGSGVEGLSVGTRVVVDPVVACGHCYACRVGRPNVCANIQVMGVHRDGGFRTQLVVPVANAIPVQEGTAPEIAALAEPLSVAANVLSRTGCGPEDTVLVYGAGTVGLTVLQVAKMKGARVIVADRVASRLEAARRFGADRVIDSRESDVVAAMRKENDGLGPSVVIDGAGVPALMAEAVAVASPAGRIGLLGFASEPSSLVQQHVVAKELSLHGSRLNRRLMPEVLDWIARGAINPEALITHTFAASDAAAAFRLIEDRPFDTIKVQLAFD